MDISCKQKKLLILLLVKAEGMLLQGYCVAQRISTRGQISLEGTWTEKISNYSTHLSWKQACCNLFQALTLGTVDSGSWIPESPQLLLETKGLCYQPYQEMAFVFCISPYSLLNPYFPCVHLTGRGWRTCLHPCCVRVWESKGVKDKDKFSAGCLLENELLSYKSDGNWW